MSGRTACVRSARNLVPSGPTLPAHDRGARGCGSRCTRCGSSRGPGAPPAIPRDSRTRRAPGAGASPDRRPRRHRPRSGYTGEAMRRVEAIASAPRYVSRVFPTAAFGLGLSLDDGERLSRGARTPAEQLPRHSSARLCGCGRSPGSRYEAADGGAISDVPIRVDFPSTPIFGVSASRLRQTRLARVLRPPSVARRTRAQRAISVAAPRRPPSETPSTRSGSRLRESAGLGSRVGHVVCGCTSRSGQAESAAVDDAGVIERVEHRDVAASEQARQHAQVHLEAGREGE